MALKITYKIYFDREANLIGKTWQEENTVKIDREDGRRCSGRS